MGNTINCKNCKNKESEKSEYNFDNELKREIESSKREKIEMEKLEESKKNFESKILEYGEIIKEEEIEEILLQKNKNINSEFQKMNQTEILDKTSDTSINNIFYEPPIKFKKDGTIYFGGWNCNFQKEGFGITINSDGSVYKGLYKQDLIDKYGFFIDKNGNYYKGNFKDGKKMVMVNYILKIDLNIMEILIMI